MNKILFDDWASTYNESIKKSEQNKTYPFYGYGEIQQYVFDIANRIPQSKILEMGIGTGVMTKRLYDLNHDITGVDFSHNMIEEARKIMPLNDYIENDFLTSLDKIKNKIFDTIVFSYSIHHLKLINQKFVLDVLSRNLSPNGKIIIGDVLTRTKADLKKLALDNKRIWDEDEYYPTLEEYDNIVLRQHYDIEFKKITHSSGVITLTKKTDTK